MVLDYERAPPDTMSKYIIGFFWAIMSLSCWYKQEAFSFCHCRIQQYLPHLKGDIMMREKLYQTQVIIITDHIICNIAVVVALQGDGRKLN
jgi:hypothetical protein